VSWNEITLGEAFTVKHGFAFKSEYFGSSGRHIVVTPGNFNEAGGFRIRPEKERFYAAEPPEEFVLKPGDLIVAMTEQGEGLLGSSAIVPSEGSFLHNQRIGLVENLDERKLDRGFLYLLFNSRTVRAQIRSTASGTKVRHTAPKRIYSVKVRVPDLAQQRAIAACAGTYQDLIENNRKRIVLLKEAVRLLYREWFVKFRFPGNEHTKVIQGLPVGWRKRALGQLTTKIGSGATPRGGEASYLSTGIPLIRSLNVYDDQFNEDGLAFIGENQAAALNNVIVESRDILLNITGASVARCCMAPERYIPARVNQHVMILRVDQNEADPFFVHAAINSDERKRQLLSYARKGATREALTKDMMAAFEITIPTEDLMRQFGEIAGTSFLQLENLANQNEKLKTARNWLLPRLMSGEIAV